jgi:hypothetical protein
MPEPKHPAHCSFRPHRHNHRRTNPNSRCAAKRATPDTGVERDATAPLGGRRQTHVRDHDGRLIELQDGVGRRYRLRYDTVHPGRKADATWPADPGLRLVGVDLVADPLVPGAAACSLVTYRYSPEGDLVAVIDRHGETVRSFAYRQHSLVFHRERSGPEHHYTYESDRPGARVVEQRNQEGLAFRFDYLDAKNGAVSRPS